MDYSHGGCNTSISTAELLLESSLGQATTTGLANMGQVIYNLLYYLYITQAPTGFIFCRSLLLLNFRSRPVQHEEKLHCIELLYIWCFLLLINGTNAAELESLSRRVNSSLCLTSGNGSGLTPLCIHNWCVDTSLYSQSVCGHLTSSKLSIWTVICLHSTGVHKFHLVEFFNCCF